MNPDINKLQEGNQAVFKEIVEQWQDMVYNTALGIVQDEADAEDITQEVFVKLYQSIRDFRQDSKLSTWIYRITINKALDHSKRKKREKQGGFLKRIFPGRQEQELVYFEHPGVLLDKKESAAILFKALNKLPEKQRVAFVLHKLEALSYKEIAAVMNISLMAVESLQVRAKNKLKQILQEYYDKHFK